MDRRSISQTAALTGFKPTALRFYEHHGLVRPARTPAGYRSYSDADVAALRFVARAKALGLTLEQIGELVGLLRGERCAPVQSRLREMVDERIADVRSRVAELIGETGELQRVAAGLSGPAADGPCDSRCACAGETEPAIECTLAPDDRPNRGREWREMLAGAARREPMPGGARVRFGRDADVGALAALAAAENDCCAWATFAITVDTAGVTLDVTGPPAARAAIASMYGGA